MRFNDLFIDSKLPKPLEAEEMYDNFEKMKYGDRIAREKIINHNIRLVISEVVRKFSNGPYDLQELVAIGLIGLVKSVDTFDYTKGAHFATYSSKCIDNEILMFMRKGEKYINDASLSQPIAKDKEGKDVHIEDTLYDINSDFVSEYEKNELYEDIRKAVNKLPERDKNIAIMYFGFNDVQPMTQKEIAIKLGLSRSYISRILGAIQKNINVQLKQLEMIGVSINQKNKEKSVEEKIAFYQTFDFHSIHKNMDTSVFFHLLELLPEEDQKWYTKYRGIDLKYKTIRAKKEQEYAPNFLNYMCVIENDLHTMYLHFKKLTQEKNIEDEAAYIRVQKYMRVHSIRFYFSAYSLKEIKEAVYQLTEKQQKIIYLRFGKNLLSFYKFPKDGKNYYMKLHQSLKKVETILQNKNIKEEEKIHKKSLRAKYKDLSFEELNNFVQSLTYSDQQILYLHHGSKLNEYIPFPNDKSYMHYYNAYKKSLANLDAKISKKEIPSLLIKLENKYTLEEVKEAITLLPKEEQEILYLRHGKDLLSFCPFPTLKPYKYYQQLYENAISHLREILKSKKYPEEYAKEQEILRQRKESQRLKIKPTKSKKKEKNWIEHDILVYLVSLLPECSQEIMYLAHGKNLDQTFSLPEAPEGEEKSFYYSIYNTTVKQLFTMYEELKNNSSVVAIKTPEGESKNIILTPSTRKKKSILDSETKEDILFAKPFLCKNQQNILVLRHGENLDQDLPYPKVPEGKNKNYYSCLYYNMCIRVHYIIENKEKFEHVDNKKTRKRKNCIIYKIEHDTLVYLVSLLPVHLQEIMYLRHGKNLDQILPWPEAPEKKGKRYYYSIYNNVVKKLFTMYEELQNTPSILEEDPKPTKTIKKKSLSKMETNKKILSKKERQKQKETLSKEKENLILRKEQQTIKAFYEKYISYTNFIPNEELIAIIQEVVLKYVNSVDHNGLEIACNMKIESEILLKLSHIYSQKEDNDESLKILFMLEEIYGERLRKRFTNIRNENYPFCYLTDGQISGAIEKTIKNYDGRLPFYTELSLVLKRTMDKN